MIALTLLLATAGFLTLALSMQRHRRDLGRQGKPPRAMRPVAFLLIGLSVFPAVADQGLAIGITSWGMALSVCAMAVAAWLTVRSSWR
ncbi:DUF3325 family protein [Altererythrobacter xixiisoli]|uniref:DUF3325 family protein n=1 Tax=Croceibacterium xixiisoli TaxID=1476466 RepID=A0A6I4U104_9SPHN|nr:DUF3325 domain-containing protein [Croceibacterium xixiisoli]MXP00344.1 DUF3325 family protein [Croceibacterium xixiisoli]